MSWKARLSTKRIGHYLGAFVCAYRFFLWTGLTFRFARRRLRDVGIQNDDGFQILEADRSILDWRTAACFCLQEAEDALGGDD